MNDEKQLILEMLKEGKITVEEANNLLEAIGSKKSRNDNDFVSKFTQSMEAVIKKTTETFENLGNFDLDNIDINQFNIRGQMNTHDEMRIDDDINNINIDIPSGKIYIERSIDSAITLSQDIWSKKSNLVDFLDVEVLGDSLNISINDEHRNYDATPVIHLSLGKNIYDSLAIDLVNGSIEVEDVDFTNSTIDSVNARITVINSCGKLDINNVNGKIDIKNTNGTLNIDNVNGSVYLSNISGQEANVDAVSGNVRIDGLNSKTFTADTTSGNIRIYHVKDAESISLDSSSGNIIIDSEGFEGEIKARIEASDLNLSEKYKNKMQIENGYEVSTNANKEDLNIDVKSGFGKVSLR